MATKAQDTKSKFASIDELIDVSGNVSAISELEAELDRKVDDEIESEKAEITEQDAAEKASIAAEKKARALELDKINRTEGAVDRIQKFCILGKAAERAVINQGSVHDAMDAEIAKVADRYDAEIAKVADRYDADVKKADKKVSAVLHMVREEFDILKEDYPYGADDCISDVLDSYLNPVVVEVEKTNGGGRSKEPDFIAGQDVFMTFKGSNFKSVATDDGVMLYGKDTANSTAAKALADEFEPRSDGKKNNIGKYWKGSPKTGVDYLDVSKAR